MLVSFCPAWQQGSTCTVLLSKDQAIPAPCLPSRPPNGKGGFQDEGTRSFFTAPSQGPDSILVFFFPPVLPSYMRIFLAALVVKDLLSAFSWFSVRIVPRVHVFLMCSLNELIFSPAVLTSLPLVSHLITISSGDSHQNAFLFSDFTASTASRGQTQADRTGYSLLVKQSP